MSASGKSLGSRWAGIGGGLKNSGGYSVEVVVVVVTTVVVVMGASENVVEVGFRCPALAVVEEEGNSVTEALRAPGGLRP